MPPPNEQMTKDKVIFTCMTIDSHPGDSDVEYNSHGKPEQNYKNTPLVMDSDGSFFLYRNLTMDKSRRQKEMFLLALCT